MAQRELPLRLLEPFTELDGNADDEQDAGDEQVRLAELLVVAQPQSTLSSSTSGLYSVKPATVVTARRYASPNFSLRWLSSIPFPIPSVPHPRNHQRQGTGPV